MANALGTDLNLDRYKEEFSILIVDDNPDNIFTLRIRLEKEGYKTIHTATDGLEALDLLDKESVDLILLDIMMPHMDGMTLLDRLKNKITNNELMVIMISAADTQENALHCIQMGAEDFLPKPFKAGLLRARVGACFRKMVASKKEKLYLEKIETEHLRFEKLLNATFPPSVIEEYTISETVKACQYSNVAVLFLDISKFTEYCEIHTPNEIMQNLQAIADITESLALKFGLEKIKTVGDAFIGTANMLVLNEAPVKSCILCAQEIIKACNAMPTKWGMRAGIDYGSIIGGFIGHRKFLYDIFGTVVNTASRLQTLAEINTIYLSQAAKDALHESDFLLESLGKHQVKGKGTIELYKIDASAK